MEEVFNKFKKEGLNSVNSIVQWFKESKIIDATTKSDEETRKLFQDVKDTANVEWEKFLQAVGKIADKQKVTIEEISKTLNEQGPKVLSALMERANSAVSAFHKAIKK